MTLFNWRSYLSLWLFALAFGWIEAAVVVYLRQIYVHEAGYPGAFGFPLVSLPARLVGVELVREACTLVVLAAVAWLAERRWAARIGAFLLAFGVWDLTYYAVLRLVLGWPDSLMTWDILFLIPLPWVAPVWAPATAAGVFVAAGSYLLWTPDWPRRYAWTDAAILAGSALMVIGAFLFQWKVVVDKQVPQNFPAWLFWAGVALGTLWFIHAERRVASTDVRAARSRRPDAPVRATTDEQVIAEYAASRRRLDTLLVEAAEIGGRLERLGRGLSEFPRQLVEHPGEWDVLKDESLPTTATLIVLTDSIRETARRVDDLRERLILMGRADLVESPDAFFH